MDIDYESDVIKYYNCANVVDMYLSDYFKQHQTNIMKRSCYN